MNGIDAEHLRAGLELLLEHHGEQVPAAAIRGLLDRAGVMWPGDLPPDPPTGPVHGWFGLSYASWMVLPRTLLQSMPIEWQASLVRLMDELERSASAAGVVIPERFRVHVLDTNGRFVASPFPHYKHAPNLLRADE